MRSADVGFARFFLRLTACHTVTYMVVGFAAFIIMDYSTQFSDPCSVMKPTDTPIVALGPALQVFRGLLFAVVLYPFRRVFLDEDRGWLKLWGLFMGLAILGTSGPAPGSFEGLVFLQADSEPGHQCVAAADRVDLFNFGWLDVEAFVAA